MFNILYRIYFYKFNNNYIGDKSSFYNINRYVEIFIYFTTIIRKSIRYYYRVK